MRRPILLWRPCYLLPDMLWRLINCRLLFFIIRSIIILNPRKIIIIIIILPSVVKIPKVKSSKKLKSKAGVARHLNRPGIPGQRKSLEIERS